jgi:hypothetical protein
MPELPETTDGRGSLPPALAEGLALAMQARDAGTPSPLADWLARHPRLAQELAAFLAGERLLEQELPVLVPAVGGLELRGKLGEGGMGVVHRAYDPVLRREVAVKMVRPGADLARFRFEAETVASLDDPNVVRVLAFGVAGGQPYLVMPLMEGGSLADRLKGRGPMPPHVAGELVRDVALGVHHAHQRGLIHRDLKPGNVLLDAAGRPHVADFGLARHLDVSASGAGIAGTAAYMAPEQARGEKVLTTAIDVHALGVILFELLTGETPFGGSDALSVMRRVVEEPAPLVRTRRKDAPADLEEVCRGCLEKAPQDRYPSALELADDLTRYLNGEPIGRRTGGWLDAVRRGLDRRRETDAMGSWYLAVWGGASVMAAMTVLQAAVLLAAPAWVGWAAVAYFLIAWLGILWGFQIVSWDRLNSVERGSTLTQLGMAFACAACLPACTWPDGDVVRALPALLAIKGLGVFAHGHWYWGRLYLVGLMYFALTALMPLIPSLAWPAVFGLWSGGIQLWVAVHLRHFHRAGSSR